jgi:hypothetical protein
MISRLLLLLLSLGLAAPAGAQSYDIALSGGHVMDPESGVDARGLALPDFSHQCEPLRVNALRGAARQSRSPSIMRFATKYGPPTTLLPRRRSKLQGL